MRRTIIGSAVVVASLWASAPSWAVHQPAPASFKLVAPGRVSQGITVKAVLKKRRTIGLVVFTQRHHTEVGTHLLGTFSGHPSIHWNLRVGGVLLRSGAYKVSLLVFAHAKPTKIPGPAPVRLVISGQHVRAG